MPPMHLDKASAKFMRRTRLKPKSSRTPLKRLKNKLTSVFQAMVRERDKDFPCISCGKRNGALQAGHFMRRNSLSTRWHPYNVNGQCGGCNGFSDSLITFRYSQALDERWGPGTAERLAALYVRSWKPDSESLEALIAAAQSGPEEYEEVYARVASHA